jgi:hypothetical protein
MNKLVFVVAIFTTASLAPVTLVAAPTINTVVATTPADKPADKPAEDLQFPEPMPIPQSDCDMVVPKCDSVY